MFFLFTFQQLFTHNFYFGYSKKYLDASINFLLFAKRNNFFLFNLNITLIYLKLVLNFLFILYFNKGFLWIIETSFHNLIKIYLKNLNKYCNKLIINSSIIKASLYLNFFFFCGKWFNGLLTNYKSICFRKSNLKKAFLFKNKHFIKTFNKIIKNYFLNKGFIFFFKKKKIKKFIKKKNFIFYPSALFFFEYSINILKIIESNKVYLPTFCIIDTNANINIINNLYIIPSNEKSLKNNYFFYKFFLLFFFKNLYYNIILFKKQIYLKVKKKLKIKKNILLSQKKNKIKKKKC